MPIYEYRCTRCQHDFESFQPVGEAAPGCPQCGGDSRKVYSSVGLIFKGSGFHTTDYRKRSPSGNGDTAPKDPASTSGATPPSAPAASEKS
ncbi:MAG: zinc ribbon domain-containing protein [Armatimonadetes bacterium]|nr:zinc ribbon domain-containing protein [Armatimonadota bacterium]